MESLPLSSNNNALQSEIEENLSSSIVFIRAENPLRSNSSENNYRRFSSETASHGVQFGLMAVRELLVC